MKLFFSLVFAFFCFSQTSASNAPQLCVEKKCIPPLHSGSYDQDGWMACVKRCQGVFLPESICARFGPSLALKAMQYCIEEKCIPPLYSGSHDRTGWDACVKSCQDIFTPEAACAFLRQTPTQLKDDDKPEERKYSLQAFE
jgi:hypothetical protein